jgi:hypothetical protein
LTETKSYAANTGFIGDDHSIAADGGSVLLVACAARLRLAAAFRWLVSLPADIGRDPLGSHFASRGISRIGDDPIRVRPGMALGLEAVRDGTLPSVV